MAKHLKAEVAYTDTHGTSNEQCSKCTHFMYPKKCEIVIGAIKPGGWCDQFRRK